MIINLKRNAYEKIIRQLVFIDENKTDIINLLVNRKLFSSISEIKSFLNGYVAAVESLLSNISILNDNNLNLSGFLPYIIIDSDFILIDKFNTKNYCHLTSNIYENSIGISKNIYVFSEIGLKFLLKKKDDKCCLDFGNGLREYKISSIRLF